MKSERVPLRGGVGVEVVGVAGHDHPCVALVSPADFPTGTEEVDLSGPSLRDDGKLKTKQSKRVGLYRPKCCNGRKKERTGQNTNETASANPNAMKPKGERNEGCEAASSITSATPRPKVSVV